MRLFRIRNNRTNYFEVDDQDKFRKLMERCAVAGEAVQIFEQTDELDPTKVIKFGFGAYGSISGLNTECDAPIKSDDDGCGEDCCEDPDYCHDDFCKALQEMMIMSRVTAVKSLLLFCLALMNTARG